MSHKEWLNEINERIEEKRRYEADVEYEMHRHKQSIDNPVDIDFYRYSGYEPDEAANELIMEKKRRKRKEELK